MRLPSTASVPAPVAPVVGRKAVRAVRVCTRCVMDTGAPDIVFDEHGFCNYCTELMELLALRRAERDDREVQLRRIVSDIRAAGASKRYDCVLGVSGGLDSSYTLYQARRLGLRPLAVHMDNGWNSELAVSNIERLVKTLGVDLFTYVLDWQQFRDLQRAFFRANVVDIEMLTDNAIMATLYRLARRYRLRYIVLGTNTANEGLRMPPEWNHLKADLRNIRAIHRRFGAGVRLTGVPLMGLLTRIRARYVSRLRLVSLLDYLPYHTSQAAAELERETGWRAYERKHYESVFTRFYQGFILPRKFNVDKRKVHFSAHICSGQMTRTEAVEMLERETYSDATLLESDREFVLKKLGFGEEEFERYLASPPVPHDGYPSIHRVVTALQRVKRATRRLFPSPSRKAML